MPRADRLDLADAVARAVFGARFGPRPSSSRLAVAVLYAALGLVTLGLGQMTGLASPVWPAAGVAFAAALRWRWRALPGVFIGSVGVNAVLADAAGRACAADLVRRRSDRPRRSSRGRGGRSPRSSLRRPGSATRYTAAVMLTLALGGLLATTIAPTIGVAAQLTTGLLSTSQAAFGWLTWWVGDAIGVIVFAPLVLMLLPSQAAILVGAPLEDRRPVTADLRNPDGRHRPERRPGANPDRRCRGAVGRPGRHGPRPATSRFTRRCSKVSAASWTRPTDVTAEEFDAYTDDLLARFPNLQALSWNPLVTEADLAAFQARQRAQPGLEDFTVTERDADGNLRPVSPRPEYVVVAYIEPIANNRNALRLRHLLQPGTGRRHRNSPRHRPAHGNRPHRSRPGVRHAERHARPVADL